MDEALISIALCPYLLKFRNCGNGPELGFPIVIDAFVERDKLTKREPRAPFIGNNIQ
jgi:hypothetical protein